MITDSTIRKKLEISNFLETLDISFLKKEGVTIEHLAILFLATNSVFDMNTNKKIISFEDADVLKNIINVAKLDVNEAVEIDGYSALLKLDTCGFSLYQNSGILELYYNKLMLCSFEKEIFNSYVYMFIKNITTPSLNAKEFYVKNIISSGNGVTTTKTENVIFKNKSCGFSTGNEVKMYYNEINERVERLKETQKEIVKMIEEDISPVMYLKRDGKYDFKIDDSQSDSTFYLDASGKFEVITEDGVNRSFAISESIVFESTYFSYKSIDCYIDNLKSKYRTKMTDPGDIEIYFDGDVILYDDQNDQKYYIKFNKNDDKNKYILKIILIDKDYKYLQLEFSADVFQYVSGKYSKKLSLDEKNALLSAQTTDTVNENRIKSVFFKNNNIRISLVNPSLPRQANINYNISTKFYKKYDTINKFFINKDISIDIEPAFLIGGEKFVGYKTNFSNDGSLDTFYSRNIDFGFLTEPEIDTGVRQIGNFDFSRGLTDSGTDVKLPIKEFNARINIFLNSIKTLDEDIIVMKIIKDNSPAYILRAKKTEEKVLTILLTKDGDAVDYTGSTPGQPACRISDEGILEIGFSVKNENGKCTSSAGDFYIKNYLSGDAFGIVQRILKQAMVLSDDTDLYFKSIFMNGIQMSKYIIDRQISFKSEVITDKKTYYMNQNIVLIPKDITDAYIFINGSDSSSLDYTNSINIIDPIKKANTKVTDVDKYVFYGSEAVISFSNVFDVIQNQEVTGFELYIYDALDYNSCQDIGSGVGKKAYKNSLTPVGVIYKRTSAGVFEPDTTNASHNITEKYFNIDKIELKYPMSFEIFNGKSRNLTVVFIVKRFGLENENLRYTKIVSTNPVSLELDIKYEDNVVDKETEEIVSTITSGKIISEESKNYFYSRMLKKIKIISNFDLRIYKEIDIVLDLYGDDPGIWMTKVDYAKGDFPSAENMEDTIFNKINSKQLKLRIVYEYDVSGNRKMVPKIEYDDGLNLITKINSVDKIYYTSNTEDTSFIEINLGIVSKTFNRNISVSFSSENIFETVPKKTVTDFLKLNIIGEFDLAQINQFYTKANTRDCPDVPMIYMLSSLTSFNATSILNYISNIKFLAPASNPASQYLKFVICGLRISSGKIVPYKSASPTEFNYITDKKESIVNENGEDYIQWNYNISFSTPSNEPIRALLILPYVVWDKIPEENPIVKIKLGDQNNDMVSMNETMIAKNYSQICRTNTFFGDLYMKSSCADTIHGLNADLYMTKNENNKFACLGKIWSDLKFGDERINTKSDTIFEDAVISNTSVDYFNLDTYSRNQNTVTIPEGTDVSYTQYLHGFDFTAIKSNSYISDVYAVNIGIKKQNYTDYKTAATQLTPKMSSLVTDVLNPLSDRVTITNISDGQTERTGYTSNFFSKSLVAILWNETVRNEMFMESKNSDDVPYVKKTVSLSHNISEKNPRMLKIEKIGFKKSGTTDDMSNTDFVYIINNQADIEIKNDIFIKLAGDSINSADIKNLLLKMKQINIPKDFYVIFRITYAFFKDGDSNSYDINITDKYTEDYIKTLPEPSNISLPFKIPAVFSMKEIFEQLGDIKLFVDNVVQINCSLIISTGQEDTTETENVTPMTLSRTAASIDEINSVTAI